MPNQLPSSSLLPRHSSSSSSLPSLSAASRTNQSQASLLPCLPFMWALGIASVLLSLDATWQLDDSLLPGLPGGARLSVMTNAPRGKTLNPEHSALFRDHLHETLGSESSEGHTGWAHAPPARQFSVEVFSAPLPFEGEQKGRQMMAIRSWLQMTPPPVVFLLGRHGSLREVAEGFEGQRVRLEEEVDMSSSGVPLFHSLLLRARASSASIVVVIHPEAILLPSFSASLEKLKSETSPWLLAAAGLVPNSSASEAAREDLILDEENEWRVSSTDATEGRMLGEEELPGFLSAAAELPACLPPAFVAWNTNSCPLHAGPTPPFRTFYRTKPFQGAENATGQHDSGHAAAISPGSMGLGFFSGIVFDWLLHEAITSGLRRVVDSSHMASAYWPRGVTADLNAAGGEGKPNFAEEAEDADAFEDLRLQLAADFVLAETYGSFVRGRKRRRRRSVEDADWLMERCEEAGEGGICITRRDLEREMDSEIRLEAGVQAEHVHDVEHGTHMREQMHGSKGLVTVGSKALNLDASKSWRHQWRALFDALRLGGLTPGAWVREGGIIKEAEQRGRKGAAAEAQGIKRAKSSRELLRTEDAFLCSFGRLAPRLLMNGSANTAEGTLPRSFPYKPSEIPAEDTGSQVHVAASSVPSADLLPLARQMLQKVGGPGMESLVRQVAGRDRLVIVSIAARNYAAMMMSWVCNLRRLRLHSFVIAALDDETMELGRVQGLPVFRLNFGLRPGNDDCHFETRCFQNVTKLKSRVALRILRLGFHVVFSDVDVYWFSDPLPHLRRFGPGRIVAQSDHWNDTGPANAFRRLNSGFYFVPSEPSTIAAMEAVVAHAANSGLSEQPSFYDTLCGANAEFRVGSSRCENPRLNVSVQFLDRRRYPNGATRLLWQSATTRQDCHKLGCVILHNNWVNGRKKKLQRQIEKGLMDFDNQRGMCWQGWHEQPTTWRIF